MRRGLKVQPDAVPEYPRSLLPEAAAAPAAPPGEELRGLRQRRRGPTVAEEAAEDRKPVLPDGQKPVPVLLDAAQPVAQPPACGETVQPQVSEAPEVSPEQALLSGEPGSMVRCSRSAAEPARR